MVNNHLVKVGDWRVDFSAGEMTGPNGEVRLEPKVNALLQALAEQPGKVHSRDELTATIWGDVVVGDDSLARVISKLRQALGDDARDPRYIETMSKRGYRLLAPVEWLEPEGGVTRNRTGSRRRGVVLALAAAGLMLLAWAGLQWISSSTGPATGDERTVALLARADDAYFQFSRADNEAAIELYTRVLGLEPDDPVALSGLANALAQRSFRWPSPAGSDGPTYTTLGDALAAGHLSEEPALSQLERAERLARRAVELAPDQAGTHKALGLVLSAKGQFDEALAAYRQAVSVDPEAWGSLINIGDVLEITGRSDEALPYFERAYEAMGRAYADEAVRVRPWHAEMGVAIAERYRQRGEWATAEGWYRRVLENSPLHPGATRGLAAALRAGGDPQAADRLCAELAQRLGPEQGCR
jgi:DNA-binding winged helix-turn-helix (wHTH) protein/Flp pilus assembly protein TadD